MDWAHVTIPGMGYTGPAIRVDYYEGVPGPAELSIPLTRESWYFVEDMGLVEIRTKQFGVGSKGGCLEESDCLQPDMATPDITLTLERRSWRTPRTFPIP
jgi:hypothetical protein